MVPVAIRVVAHFIRDAKAKFGNRAARLCSLSLLGKASILGTKNSGKKGPKTAGRDRPLMNNVQ